jgi:hypothetical protein
MGPRARGSMLVVPFGLRRMVYSTLEVIDWHAPLWRRRFRVDMHRVQHNHLQLIAQFKAVLLSYAFSTICEAMHEETLRKPSLMGNITHTVQPDASYVTTLWLVPLFCYFSKLPHIHLRVQFCLSAHDAIDMLTLREHMWHCCKKVQHLLCISTSASAVVQSLSAGRFCSDCCRSRRVHAVHGCRCTGLHYAQDSSSAL